MKKVKILIAALMTITILCCCDSKKTKTETKTVSAPKQETVISETKKETEIKNTKTSEDVKMSAETLEALNGKEGVFVVLTTEKGQIVLELFFKETPMTVSNFVGLAEGTLDAAKGKPFMMDLPSIV